MYPMLCINAVALVNTRVNHFGGVWSLPSGSEKRRVKATAHSEAQNPNASAVTLRGACSLIWKTDVCASRRVQNSAAWGAHGGPAIMTQATRKYPLIRMTPIKRIMGSSTCLMLLWKHSLWRAKRKILSKLRWTRCIWHIKLVAIIYVHDATPISWRNCSG